MEYCVFGIHYIRDVLYLAYLNLKYPVLCDIVYFLYSIFENISYSIFPIFGILHPMCTIFYDIFLR